MVLQSTFITPLSCYKNSYGFFLFLSAAVVYDLVTFFVFNFILLYNLFIVISVIFIKMYLVFILLCVYHVLVCVLWKKTL